MADVMMTEGLSAGFAVGAQANAALLLSRHTESLCPELLSLAVGIARFATMALAALAAFCGAAGDGEH